MNKIALLICDDAVHRILLVHLSLQTSFLFYTDGRNDGQWSYNILIFFSKKTSIK